METELFDFNMGGEKYTYMATVGGKLSKLDRFLVSLAVNHDWSNLDVIAVSRTFSDHTPLILKHNYQNYGPTPFKFYNYWLKESDLEEMIRASWETTTHNEDDHKLYTVAGKLKTLM